MIAFVLIGLVGVLAGLIVAAHALKRTGEGYEDELGFHFGKSSPKVETRRRHSAPLPERDGAANTRAARLRVK